MAAASDITPYHAAVSNVAAFYQDLRTKSSQAWI